MTLEAIAFEKTLLDMSRLETAGFVLEGEKYVYREPFMEGDFEAVLCVSKDGILTGTVYDQMTGEEYFPVHIQTGAGGYVRTVQRAYLEILQKIAEKCGIQMPFRMAQSNRIAQKIRERYGDLPEYPWDSEANKETAVFRNPTSEKWYGLLADVAEKKVTKNEEDSEEKIEILNLKIDPKKRERIDSLDGIYPAWHMSHKSWISVRLDDRVADEVILELIEDSHAFTEGKSSKRKECHSWILPANLKYYDIVSDFDQNEYSDWKYYKGISENDIVYMYVGAPYSAILYRCVVTKVEEETVPGLMGDAVRLIGVRILDRYDKTKFQRKGVMTDFGVTTVRGPRSMPKELEDYIEKNK